MRCAHVCLVCVNVYGDGGGDARWACLLAGSYSVCVFLCVSVCVQGEVRLSVESIEKSFRVLASSVFSLF